jgi:hypothetical protein
VRQLFTSLDYTIYGLSLSGSGSLNATHNFYRQVLVQRLRDRHGCREARRQGPSELYSGWRGGRPTDNDVSESVQRERHLTSATGQDVFWTDFLEDITMPIDEGFLPQGLGFQCNCSGSVLTLHGFVNGTTRAGGPCIATTGHEKCGHLCRGLSTQKQATRCLPLAFRLFHHTKSICFLVPLYPLVSSQH